MMCKGNLCEYNSFCEFEDRTECIREKSSFPHVEEIDIFSSDPFNNYGWKFKYYQGFFYNTGTCERYFLKRKGKSFEITKEFLKDINNSYRRCDKVIDSRIKNTLEKYIINLIKRRVI